MSTSTNKLFKFIFCLGLFLSPFIFWSNAPIAYEIPRVWFLNRWIELMALLGIFSFRQKQANSRKDGFLILLVWLFVLIAVIASLLGVDMAKSFWGNMYRSDGLFTFFHLLGLFFLLALFWQKEWQYPMAVSIVAGSSFVSFWNMGVGLRLYFLQGQSFLQPIGTTFGQPNFLAGYLLICLAFISYLHEKTKNLFFKRLLFLALISHFLAIIFTLSRAGILGIVLFLLLRAFFLKKRYLKQVIMITFLFAFCLGAVFLYKTLNSKEIYIADNRVRIFTKGLMGTAKRPFLGWGWANFDHAFESVDWPMKLTNDVYVDKAHSHFLEILATTGILGLIFYLLIIFHVFKKLLSENIVSQWFLLVFVLFILHSQTNVISIAEELIFWIILGITASQKPSKENSAVKFK
ncbi:O-antigen ligase family protein [Candidatus Microgenomates bacterium]|nr:O-antigen ligase family protein [Candidatus Microgenomates bacterium]